MTPTRIDPILLKKPIHISKFDIVFRASRKRRSGAEIPGAFIGVLVAALVEPSIEVGVRHAFRQLVSNEVRHAIGAQVAVWRGGLGRTGRRTPQWIADETEFDVLA